ncbi:type I glyceraldehyde-3-phosphate dehydrogenase [uncultured Pseudoteredinibacter sp.]|uniref:type I glyceraldehyde-3-phosphate dehydrogenase n=1 Tax=uncultured Pseudoteredinibacter sp. TaxID=1641701 RepID=UPI00262F4286|nr:type I glyceraldehyde-3-phosphate dehydrogenase [uncultured Pseudoteredinibacter sp.]
MGIRVAINGFGRIGRNIFRAIFTSEDYGEIELVAINDLAPPETNLHLARFDSVHGRFPASIEIQGKNLLVEKQLVQLCSEADPEKLPWADLSIDIVLECTGLFTSREKSAAHIQAGAKKVIISAPAKNVDATVVYGVNHHCLDAACEIISNASCTTNCLAPLAMVLNQSLGIERGIMTTIHAYTSDQQLQDVYHKDIYRSRAAALSMIPTETGAAQAVALVLPELAGRLDGMAVRVPTANVSLVDFSFIASKATTVDEVNKIIRKASENLPRVLAYNDLPLVSADFNHQLASSNFDATQTKASENLVKVMAWYDNEWAFANRMLDNCSALMAVA